MNKDIVANNEAEQALLGAILINPNVLSKLDVTGNDFFLVRHRFIFEGMQTLKATGQNIDILTVSDNLDRRGKLKETGGVAYIQELINKTPSGLHADSYASVLRDCAKRRSIIETAGKMATGAYDMDKNLEDTIASAMTDIVRSSAGTGGAIPISEFASELYDQVEKAAENPKDIYGIQTGIMDYDNITGGQQKGDVTIITGKPGLGKSLFSFQMCCGMAEHEPGAIYGMEMTGLAMVRRQVSGMSNITTKKMRSGRIADGDWPSFIQAVEKISSLPIFISDASDMTSTRMRADLARLKEAYGISWFMVDYLDLFNDMPDQDINSRGTYISKQVHGIAKDLNLSCIAIQSMNKTGMGEEHKGMASLSGSGKYSFDADNVIIMTKVSDNIIRLTWDKHREGELISMELVKRPGFPAFGEKARDSSWSDK
jgi:replicative DNA helicase